MSKSCVLLFVMSMFLGGFISIGDSDSKCRECVGDLCVMGVKGSDVWLVCAFSFKHSSCINTNSSENRQSLWT